jgi:phospholipase/lecithinase/hemolysin
MRLRRFAIAPRLFLLLAVLVLTLNTAFAQTDFTHVVVFGDSLSDVGNVAHITQSSFLIRYPSNTFNYADGRFTDDTGTKPSAVLHTGVWIEQFAAKLPAKPVIKNSLDGGTDYAYGDATTGNGTTNIPIISGVSANVNNIGQQITDYLANTPHPDVNTLYILWGGANDLYADDTSPSINATIANIVALAKRLTDAGATNLLVPNLPPLGSVPKYAGQTAKIAELNQASLTFRDQLATALNTLQSSLPAVKIYQLDVYTLFMNVQAQPSMYNVTNITTPAQGANAIADNYLFWDTLHPTTTGHFLLANAATTLLPPSMVSTTTVVTSSLLNANQGTSIILTATVTPAVGSGTPTGTVTFKDGSTALGTGTLDAGSATFTTSTLSAGTHTVTAIYGGGGGFLTSTSASITQTIAAPSFSAAASPTTLTIARGATGTTTITVTPAGGFSATVSLACGALPNPHLSCAFAPPSLAFTGSATPMTSSLSIGTAAVSALIQPALPGQSTPQIFFAFVFPVFEFSGFAAFRRRKPGQQSLRLLTILLVLSAGAILGLSVVAALPTRLCPAPTPSL